MRHAFYRLPLFVRSIACIVTETVMIRLPLAVITEKYTATFSIRLKVNESRFNSVWGSLIYRSILVQDAYIPFKKNWPEFATNSYLYIYMT